MIFHETRLSGAFLLELEQRQDARGFFARTFCRKEFEAHGINPEVAQCNMSVNHRKGTLRGMHYQTAPHQETKLVRCVRGAIFDAIIDLRPESPTFGQWAGFELTEESSKMLYVPGEFAHGYLTLTEQTEVIYQVSAFYSPECERGIRWNDPAFGIKWPILPEVVSDKDAAHPLFKL